MKEKVEQNSEKLKDTEINKESLEKNEKAKAKTSAEKSDEKKAEEKSDEPETAEKESNEEAKAESEEKKLKQQLSALNDKYLRLTAEFDNYRKRTLKEKIDMTKTAGEDLLMSILPVVDNFERGIKSIDEAKEIDAVKEGMNLIYKNFKEFLNQKGVKEIEAMHKEFDTDVHEAVTKIPAPSKKLKGKIVDVIEKGYFLHNKVIRFAKVVIGE
ncbi:MAG: nucleotide exchange factor GrpE [Bacteroidia bacterium]|nr:MAG: nucleotide exchange factor GrpE [Bacteroidia bacterium]